MTRKAVRWKNSYDGLYQHSTRIGERHCQQLLQLGQWVDEAGKATLSLEHFVNDYNINFPLPPANCRVDILDLLCLRKDALLNDNVIFAALPSICEPVGAKTYPIVSYNVVANVTLQLKRAIRTQGKKVVLCLQHKHHWVGVFVDISSSQYFISNSLGPDEPGTTYAC